MNLPAIDQDVCGAWTQLDRDTYNTVPYYLMKATAEFRRDWSVFGNLLDSVAWKPNQGPLMKSVMTERSPVIRQTAYPQLLTEDPTTDIPITRERTATGKPRWHDFESVSFNWYPEFNDFLPHVMDALKDINRQVGIYEEMFYKTYMWNMAPYVYIAGYGLVAAPQAEDATGKSAAWLQAQINRVGANGQLTYAEMFNALNKFEQEVGGTPYSGSGVPGKDSSPLTGKYGLVTASETYNSWAADPWVQVNRPLALNLISDAMYGDPWGRFVTKLEAYPRRFASTAGGATITEHAPETVQLNPDSDDFGRTYPNPNYASPAVSQYTLSWLIGGKAYSKINVGPPPGDFTKMDPMMDWNGKARIIKSMLVPCTDANGNVVQKFNERGRYLKAIATLMTGIIGNNKFNVLPILHKRPQFIIPNLAGPAVAPAA